MSGLRSIVEALGSFVQKILYGSRSTGIQIKVEHELPSFWNKWDIKSNGFKPSWIVIHHSFSADGKTRDWAGIKAYHMSFRYQGETISEKQYDEYKAAGKTAGLERPWKDIAYNLGIENIEGKITLQTGRQIGSIGAHTIGFNDCSIGICLVGNFDSTPPEDDKLFLLGSVCRDFQHLFGIAKDHVVGHRETFVLRGVPVEKSCPGAMFDVAKFRERLI